MTVPAPLHPEAALGLSLAIVESSMAPLLLLDGDLRIVASSASFCATFDLEPGQVQGRALAAVGDGEWAEPTLLSLLRAAADGYADIDSFEMTLAPAGREARDLTFSAQRLDYAEGEDVRLLVSVADQTAARLAAKLREEFRQERAAAFQEIQHRTANSLQIVASVLMQSARRTQSEETRAHLHDAHQRVMSVAVLQHQLAASMLGEVELEPYLTDLCASIGASMIRDPRQLSLDVVVDDSVTSADASVSLGLIVTELVINALKHAFPDGRRGKIVVGYNANRTGWILSVVDNGVGMPRDGGKPGLGSTIVRSLAKQLGARVGITDAHPGTSVVLIHA